MPVETTDKYVRVRVRDPGDFEEGSFRTIDISEEQGISAVIGRPKGSDKTEVQSYLFDKERWSEAEAEAWVKEHKKNNAPSHVNLRWLEVKAVELSDGIRKLMVLAAPYGGPQGGKDRQGEYFDEATDFMTEIGDARPVIYFHGLTPAGKQSSKPEVIGRGTAIRRDERGVWFEVILEKGKSLVERIWKAAKNGILRASTGSIPHLVRRAQDGHILTWPIGELSLMDVGGVREPANDFAVAVPLKSLYTAAGIDMPEAFVEADEAKAEAAETELAEVEEPKESDGGNTMAEELDTGALVAETAKAVLAALDAKEEARKVVEAHDAEIAAKAVEGYQKELESRLPAWKGGFATKKLTELGLANEPVKAFIHYLRTGDEIAAKAALQIGTSSEGGYLVPNEFESTIVARRNEVSWLRAAGVRSFRGSRDIMDVPRQYTSTAKFSVTAEEGSYSESEPTFAQVQITAYKFTKLIKVSEELLEDTAANLEEFLSEEIAQGMALTEGYYATMGSGSSQPQGVAAADSDTVPYYDFASAAQIEPEEIMGMFYTPNSAYRANGTWVMNGSIEGYLRGLRDANNWAFNPAAGGVVGAAMNLLLGRPVFNEDGMTGTTSGVPVASTNHLVFGDWNYYGLYERAGLSIVRNPWLYQASGQVGIFCRFRLGGAILQSEAFVVGNQTA